MSSARHEPGTGPTPRAGTSSDVRVIALIGFIHAVSHFFVLVLPTLFPWVMKEFGLSFTVAGSLSAVFFSVSAVGQSPAGFAVDRYGPRRVLWAGVALLSLAGVVLALSRGYLALLVAALLAGAGNAVFHPADFTVLNVRVRPARLGHAFSIHGFSGNVGYSLAPVALTAIAATAGWRVAAGAAAALGIASLLALQLFGGELVEARARDERGDADGQRTSPFAFLRAATIWMCFAFFVSTTMAVGAFYNFGPSLLRDLYGLSLGAAASALTLYLAGGAVGILLGGFLATRWQAHERVVAVMLVVAALLAVALATGAIPGLGVLPLMTAIGLCTGTAGPSRDLLVRRAAKERFGQRSYGSIYGFVYSGFDVGLSLSPLLFGAFMDRGMLRAVLCGVAVFQTLAVLAALRVGQPRAPELPVESASQA